MEQRKKRLMQVGNSSDWSEGVKKYYPQTQKAKELSVSKVFIKAGLDTEVGNNLLKMMTGLEVS